MLAATPVRAWKPTSHVFFANIALQDALDDGAISIPDLSTGRTLSYPVDPAVLAALRTAAPQYRAGLLGPDAYPDIATGQQSIHPVESDSGVPGGSDTWLTQVWRNFDHSPAEQAFRLGFLTHAAGDMYGHSFINHFTGGPFRMVPPDNAIKHVVLEGYVDKRLPAQPMQGAFWDASIAGLEARIYQVMVDARPGTDLNAVMGPNSGGGTFSVPRIFSTMRAQLQRDIDAYYAEKARLKAKADKCSFIDPTCWDTAKLNTFVMMNGPVVTYKELWRDDIDTGLRAWPATSQAVARALFFNAARKADVDTADTILTRYSQDHLLAMAGAPKFVGGAWQTFDKVVAAITPDFLLVPLRALKEEMLNTLLKAAVGMDKAQIKKYLTTPDRYFDQVMTVGAGENVTLRRFNADYLKISDTGYTNPAESFDWRNLPAAYDTVIMSKLILVAPQQRVDTLIRDLGGTQTLAAPNVMLGFIRTLDGSMQWQGRKDAGGPVTESDRMVMARDCAVYDRLFKPLPGGGGCRGWGR